MYSVIIQLYADDAKVFSNNVNDLQSSLGRVYSLSVPGYVSINFFSPPVNVNICAFLALSILRLIIFVLIHTIPVFVQLLLLKTLVRIFRET